MRVYKVELFPDEELEAKTGFQQLATGASISSVEVDKMPADDCVAVRWFRSPKRALNFIKLKLILSDACRKALAETGEYNPTEKQ